jgi:hypothetical protein
MGTLYESVGTAQTEGDFSSLQAEMNGDSKRMGVVRETSEDQQIRIALEHRLLVLSEIYRYLVWVFWLAVAGLAATLVLLLRASVAISNTLLNSP